MMLVAIFLSLILCGVSYVIFWIRRRQQLFKERNVKHIKPLFFFGNSFDALFGRRHVSEIVDDEYHSFPDEDIIGHYELFNPQFVVRNADFVTDILVRDFADFHDRVKTDGEIRCPADANLFFLIGNTWRAVRYKFSPLFTSGKLKFMYQSITECGKTLRGILDKKDGEEVEMGDTMGLFAMDVIGSTAFGIEPHLQQNPDSKFREMGLKAFENNILLLMKMFTIMLLPKVARFLNLQGFSRDYIINYFAEIVESTMAYRKQNGFIRNDFVQMMLQLKEKGKIEMQVHDPGDDYLIMEKTNEIIEVEITDDILIGGALSFLFAGFHATAMTLTYTLFELSQSPEATEKLREEIRQTVKGDEPTYEELKNMPYAEMVVKEAMRIHPTAPAIVRVCNRDYTFPNGLQVKSGETMFIPVYSIQMDPAYWPDPHVFKPERFHPDTPPRPGTYLPFGEGPRICIAMRFAMMELKYALVSLMKNYNFELSDKTQLPLRMTPKIFLATPEGGITFRVTKIKE